MKIVVHTPTALIIRDSRQRRSRVIIAIIGSATKGMCPKN